MPMVATADEPSMRCALRHVAEQVDPAGTASVWDAVLVVEVPLPWARDITEAEPFASLCERPVGTITGSDGRTWRPQGIVPDDPDAGVRVIAHEGPSEGVGPMTRREWLVPPDARADLVALCRALLEADAPALERFEGMRDDPPAGTVDVLLCTHGARDVCCGGSGTALFNEVLAAMDTRHSHARLFRTSHTGGHRFAPTALSFPEGVAWAHLDAGTLLAVLAHDGDPATLGPHVRGAVTLGGSHAQVADREGFLRWGWDWFTERRSVRCVQGDPSGDASRTEVLAESVSGGSRGVVVDVELAGHIPKVPCGEPASGQDPLESVWRVTGVST